LTIASGDTPIGSAGRASNEDGNYRIHDKDGNYRLHDEDGNYRLHDEDGNYRLHDEDGNYRFHDEDGNYQLHIEAYYRPHCQNDQHQTLKFAKLLPSGGICD
jgi:Ser/Thr protein kinase RdoA (MazF antagonist)